MIKYILFLLFTINICSQTIDPNKVYYFYFSMSVDKQMHENNLLEKQIWIFNDSTNEVHEFSFYNTKKLEDITNITYIGVGFIQDIFEENNIIYFKCSRFRKYVDFQPK